MSFNATPMGTEHLILLPVDAKAYNLTTDQSAQDIGFWLNDVDDDDIHTTDVEMVVGPLWRDLVQVSPSVSIGGIVSHDSDEVDESWSEEPVQRAESGPCPASATPSHHSSGSPT